MSKRYLRLLLVASFAVATMLPVAAHAAGPVPAADDLALNQSLSTNVPGEPNSIDPALISSVAASKIVSMNFEGLTHVVSNQNGQPVAKPGVAKSWEVSDDGLTWTFHLRNSTFSNGDPVTAQTFIYSWQRVLEPETASPYAYQLYYIKNAADINAGNKSADTLGVKALDPHTLQVTLEAPTPYFQFIAGFQTLFPVDPKVVEAHPRDWTQSGDTYVGNGPFKMTQWMHNQEIDLVKNPQYWDAEHVYLNNLQVTLVAEPMTEYTMFKTNQLQLTAQTPAQLYSLLKLDPDYNVAPFLTTYFYVFNLDEPPLDNVNVRRALNLAFDRTLITDKILKQGQIPAAAVVPPGIADADDGDFRAEGGNFFPPEGDVQKARALLAKAGYPNGKGFPTLTLTYNSSSVHKLIAQAIQQMWKKNLGIDVELQQVEPRVWVQKLNARTGYQVLREGWTADYPDPMTFLDMWTTNSGNNASNFDNDAFNRLVDKAKSTGDQSVRMDAMHKAEQILIDQAAVAPIYFYVQTWMQKQYVQGVDHLTTGNVDLTHAWIAKH